MSFKKTLKQQEAIPLLGSKKYAALYGGSRSGKTFIIVYGLLVRASKEKSRHVIVRRTFASVKRSVWLDTLPKVLSICFPDLPVKYNKSDFYITLPNGSEIWLAGLDDSRVEKILGMEFSTIYFNEASELEYSPLQTVISRLAQKNNLKKKVWFDFNPPNKSHWSYWLFIKGLEPLEGEPLENADEYGHILMNPKDNLENIDEEYLKILERMPERDRQRFLEGKFSDESDGQAYYEFNREVHVMPVKQYPGTVFIASDFNVDPHCSIAMQFIDGKLKIFKEFFTRNSDTPKAVSNWSKAGLAGAIVIPDSTGKNRKSSGQSDFDIIKQAGFQIRSTHNPFVKDRVNNVNRCLKHGLIEIDPSCKKLINDLEKVQWKDNKLDQRTDPLLTHISDALGYACHSLLPQTKLDLKPFTGRR